jgi:PAS domain S-box-containing protein
LIETNDKIKNKIYQMKKFPIVLENGKVGVGGFLNEMGVVKEAEVNLKQQGTALYTSENAVAIYDTSGNILSINPAFTRLTGYTPTDALGMNIDELLNTDTLNEELCQNIWNTILKGEIWSGVMTNRKKDSNTYHEKVTITPVINSEGVVSQFITHRQNITEKAMSEMNNQGTDWNYNELVNNANIGICTVSLQGKILHANDVMVSLLEFSNTDNLKSTNMPTVFRHPEHWKIMLEGLLTNSLVQNLDVEMITSLGRTRSVVLNAILDGNKIKLMVLDVTPQRKVEEDLQKTKIKANENEQLKNTFLTNLGHDIRIPISAIHGFTGLLSSTSTPIKDKERYVELINESSQQLLRLVNGFIELSKIATGDATVNPISFSLNNLLRQLYAELRPETLKKNLNLTYHLGVADNLSRIRFDDQKLKAILTNLLDNAIKYTDRGTIDFGYEISGSTIELFVRDTGRGISPDYQKVILDRFRVLEDPYTRKFEGHGLGLPISKAYTELLGGKIHVNSQVNVGSEFIFTIPYLPVSETVQSTPDKLIKDLNLDNHKILVVEDDEVNFMFIERLLNKTNVTILRAINGQEAVNICANDNTIDMVLMDIHLPFMSGLDATRIIKHKTPELPVIAVTAYSQSDDKATCIAAGCDDYIPKPINRGELFSKLNSFLVN